jgi:hypothetical protein
MTQDEIDAIARAVIQRWIDEQLKGLSMSLGSRAAVLLTVSRVAHRMAEEAIMQLPPWAG